MIRLLKWLGNFFRSLIHRIRTRRRNIKEVNTAMRMLGHANDLRILRAVRRYKRAVRNENCHYATTKGFTIKS